MNRIIFIFTILTFSFLFSSSLSAQNLLASTSETPLEATTLHIVADDDSGIFFTDPENKLCFIDFSEINGYAKHLYVKNEANEMVIDEVLWDLPENSIYELDFEEYTKGNYKIELHTYASIINKKLDVR